MQAGQQAQLLPQQSGQPTAAPHHGGHNQPSSGYQLNQQPHTPSQQANHPSVPPAGHPPGPPQGRQQPSVNSTPQFVHQNAPLQHGMQHPSNGGQSQPTQGPVQHSQYLPSTNPQVRQQTIYSSPLPGYHPAAQVGNPGHHPAVPQAGHMGHAAPQVGQYTSFAQPNPGQQFSQGGHPAYGTGPQAGQQSSVATPHLQGGRPGQYAGPHVGQQSSLAPPQAGQGAGYGGYVAPLVGQHALPYPPLTITGIQPGFNYPPSQLGNNPGYDGNYQQYAQQPHPSVQQPNLPHLSQPQAGQSFQHQSYQPTHSTNQYQHCLPQGPVHTASLAVPQPVTSDTRQWRQQVATPGLQPQLPQQQLQQQVSQQQLPRLQSQKQLTQQQYQAWKGSGQSNYGNTQSHQTNSTYINNNVGMSSLNDQNIPVLSAPPPGAQPLTPTYDLFIDASGKTCKVPRQAAQAAPTTRTEFRCSPLSGKRYTVQVPLQTKTPPQVKRLEWRCNPQTGELYQVEVPAPQLSSQPQGHLEQPQVLPWSGQDPGQGSQRPSQQLQHQHESSGDFEQQLQNKIKGIFKLDEGGVTKKTAKTIDFAKKGSAKWAKKTTSENINLPLYTYGAVSELESSLSGRSEAMSEEEFLAKLRHIKNILDVCCLNSESTDFKGYGWTLAKDYAQKVEGEIEQKISSWVGLSAGVQTSQLLLAQMDNPKPAGRPPPRATDRPTDRPADKLGEKGGGKIAPKPRCPTYNSCKTEDKCEYELSHPETKCILKHECNWCKSNLNQTWRHQEWGCKNKKKN